MMECVGLKFILMARLRVSVIIIVMFRIDFVFIVFEMILILGSVRSISVVSILLMRMKGCCCLFKNYILLLIILMRICLIMFVMGLVV